MRLSLAALLSACFLLAACEPSPETETPATPGASSAGLIATAAYDAVLKAPKCTGVMSACNSGGLLNGRAGLGPEANQPNTLGGTCADGTAGTFHSDESIDALQVTTVDGSDFGAGKTVRVDATVWVYSTMDALDVYASDSATSPVWTLVGTVTPPGAGQRILSLTYPLTSGAVQAVRAQFRWGGSATPCTAGSYNDHDDLAFDVGAPPPPAPMVTLTAPLDRSSISGMVLIAATPAPGFLPTKMDILLDGQPMLFPANGPWTWNWDTQYSYNSGAHVLTAKAYDAAGNTFTSAPVNVVLHNPGNAEYDPVLHAPRCNDLYRMCFTVYSTYGRSGGESNSPNTIDGCQDGTQAYTFPTRFVSYVQAQNVMNNAISGSFAPGRQVLITVGALAMASTDKIDIWWATDALNPQWMLLGSFSPTQANQFNNFNLYFTPPAGALQAIRGTIRQGSAPAVPCGSGNSDWDADDLVITFASDLADADAPAITSMTPPTNSDVTGNGSVALSSRALDAIGVTLVDYFDGATLIGSAGSGLSVSWNTLGIPEGPRTITAVAHDAAGHVSAPYSATYVIDRTMPTAVMTAPLEGATVSGTVTLSATASDDRSMNGVTFYAGTTLIGTAKYGSWQLNWNTTGYSNGTYAISARAEDAAHNITWSAPVHVTVSNASSGGVTYDPTLHVPMCGSVSNQCDSGSLLVGRSLLGPEPNQPNTLAASPCADGTGGTLHSDESVDRIVISSTSGQPLARGQSATVTVTAWIWGASSDFVDVYLSPSATAPTWTYLTTLQAPASGLRNLSTSFVVPATATTLPAVRATIRYGGAASVCTTGPFDDHDDLAFTVQ